MLGWHVTLWTAPLAGALVAGLGCRRLAPAAAHGVTIAAVGVSCLLSWWAVWDTWVAGRVFHHPLYTWAASDGLVLRIGLLVDRLSALMAATVTGVSLLVHVYSIGYMRGDPGYNRFFAYIAFFTWAMLALVLADGLLLLFVGWEGVGLASYLLIGFWFTRPRAGAAALKAFLLNRVGDLGMVLGIAVLAAAAGALDYPSLFAAAERLGGTPAVGGLSAATVGCALFLFGVAAKSAQMPLHAWLPDSMEGPTPISALIHAATMVTAGVYLVARLAPLFEQAPAVRTALLLIGALTALATGLLGLVERDIKRVIAFSTLSQLGYMVAALGASAYAAAIFHLFTHAFFKALLFLAAGSVILAMHHAQDLAAMGGLRRRLPLTYWTALAGVAALMGVPGTSGYFSKEAILAAVGGAGGAAGGFAAACLQLGVAVTALYSLRLFLLVFHGAPRSPQAAAATEPGAVVTVPLLVLAVPSLFVGASTVAPIGAGLSALWALPAPEGMHGAAAALRHGLATPAPWTMLAAAVAAFYLWGRRPGPAAFERARWLAWLRAGYGFDAFYERLVPRAVLACGRGLARRLEAAVIDETLVHGTARLVLWLGAGLRRWHAGRLDAYALGTIVGVLLLWLWS
ncbi:MAG: NADH-quinone oxidoreductase subunit L [Gammaproteobacteria bacterium]|nr:MAG: NADH-quinone oxidoreductase subunit L [Gammaproteobacteria bacterium]